MMQIALSALALQRGALPMMKATDAPKGSLTGGTLDTSDMAGVVVPSGGVVDNFSDDYWQQTTVTNDEPAATPSTTAAAAARTAEWLPGATAPAHLDGSFAGDYGFDP